MRRIAASLAYWFWAAIPRRDRLWLQMSARQFFGRDKLERHLPTSVRMAAFRRGFLPAHYVAYGLDRGLNDPALYVTDRTWSGRTLNLNGAAERYLNDKFAWHQILDVLVPDMQPTIYGIVIDGRYLPARGQALEELLEKGPGLVFKPVAGSRGRGISIVHRDGDLLLLNRRPTSADQVIAHTRGMRDHIVSERLLQHPYAAALYPDTTNTLRVLALRDPATQEPFIPGAVQRIGTRRSVHVDNWSMGGVNARVDAETGQLGQAVQYPYDGRLVWHSQHPDTGAPIQGVVVAYWPQVCRLVLTLMRALPSLRNVGWDIAVTPDGPRVIEGNNGPDVRTLQVHRGLLSDERCRRFYAALP